MKLRTPCSFKVLFDTDERRKDCEICVNTYKLYKLSWLRFMRM